MKDNCNKIRINISTGLLNLLNKQWGKENRWKFLFQFEFVFTREICFWISASSSFSGRKRANGWCWPGWYIVLRIRTMLNNKQRQIQWMMKIKRKENLINLSIYIRSKSSCSFLILMNHWTWNDIDIQVEIEIISFFFFRQSKYRWSWNGFVESTDWRFIF